MPRAPREEPQPDPLDTPAHREALAAALLAHADDIADDDPERAELAERAAAAAATEAQLPYIRGTWGGRPNYTCRWCDDAHLSERSAAIHGLSCSYRKKATAAPRRTVGGIT